MGYILFFAIIIFGTIYLINRHMQKKPKNGNGAGGNSASAEEAERECQMVEASILPHLMGMKIIEMLKSMSANPDFPEGLYMDFKVCRDKYEFVVHHPAGYTDTVDASYMQVKNANRQEWGSEVIDKEFDYLFTYAARAQLEKTLMEKYISKVPGFQIQGNRITKKVGAGPKAARDLTSLYTYYAVKAMVKHLLSPDNEQMAQMRNATKNYVLVAKPTELEIWFEGWNTTAPKPFCIVYANMNDNPEYNKRPELLFTNLNQAECDQLVERLTSDIVNECPYLTANGNKISYI